MRSTQPASTPSKISHDSEYLHDFPNMTLQRDLMEKAASKRNGYSRVKALSERARSEKGVHPALPAREA